MNDYEIEFAGLTIGSLPYCLIALEGLGSPELRSDEVGIPNTDGVVFGREFLGSRKWTISGAVKGGSADRPSTASEVQDAWNSLSALIKAWDDPAHRETSRTVTSMKFKRPGREAMLMYGRPERIDPDTEVSHSGYIRFEALWRQSDPYFYSDTENTMSISIVTPYVGGILYNGPKTALGLPFATTAYTSRVGAFNQSGSVRTWPIITIQGPVQNPSVKLQNGGSAPIWDVKLQTTIVSGQSIVIDTRPWKRTVLRSDGANLAGALRGNRLAEMYVPPGNNELVYGGADATATSTCELRYRNAWAAV